jgi:phosphomannomutase
VTDQAAKIAEVEAAYPGAQTDHLDGLTVRFDDGAWLNLRPSNTEPLLRLNVEASTRSRMEQVRDAALAIVRA